jgi:hypothetical protein
MDNVMRKTLLLFTLVTLLASCGDGSSERKNPRQEAGTEDFTDKQSSGDSLLPSDTRQGDADRAGKAADVPGGAILIATDIVTEVVIRPDPDGDPWETEKVAGYNGGPLVEGIFGRIYNGSLTVYDYHSGEPLTPADVKKIEGEFENDRNKIGKLSFTEDWYYFPEENRLEKRAKSVTFGYELYNNAGKVYAYRAAFRADLNR